MMMDDFLQSSASPFTPLSPKQGDSNNRHVDGHEVEGHEVEGHEADGSNTEGRDVNWHDANWHYTMQAIAHLHETLSTLIEQLGQGDRPPDGEGHGLRLPDAAGLHPQPRLLQICRLFRLSSLELTILLLCVGVELTSSLPLLCASLAGDPQRAYVTFNLVLMLFPTAHWHAFHPDSPLRRWRLIEIGAGNTLTASPVRIDERILHYILGGHHTDQRLQGMITVSPAGTLDPPPLSHSHQQLVDRVAQTALVAAGHRHPLQLCGLDAASKQAIATAACAQAGLGMATVLADALPTDRDAFNQVQRLCEREALLTHSALVLDCDRLASHSAAESAGPPPLEGAIARWIDTTPCPMILSSQERRPSHRRSLVTLELGLLSADEQRVIWQQGLGDRLDLLNRCPSIRSLDLLVTYFNLSAPAIRSACAAALSAVDQGIVPTQGQGDETSQSPDGSDTQAPQALHQALWNACLIQARPRLDDLAQFIDSQSTWDDLVLPDKEKGLLQTIAAHVRQRATVYEQWGFARQSRRGLGISTLFAGASGTGKTMAAEVLARDLHLNLYRIDLSSVVSKYIGETEKNLRRIFDAAETGGAILLFDEADALFGKRSEVKDSHDRYANMEVAYLLQRIEAYRGLAILTTNLKGSLDQAFLRRIRFVIQFPFPDAAQRAEIWRRVFPKQTPTRQLVPEKLANLQVAGGNIRNIAINAAFLAADAGEPVQMKHLLTAAQSEYIKLERPLTDDEVKGWIRKETQPFAP